MKTKTYRPSGDNQTPKRTLRIDDDTWSSMLEAATAWAKRRGLTKVSRTAYLADLHEQAERRRLGT